MRTLTITFISILLAAARFSALQPDAFPERPLRPDIPAPGAALPRGYSSYEFGMSFEEVAALIESDPALHSHEIDMFRDFGYTNWNVLIATGMPFFRYVYFLFFEKTLFAIVLDFNNSKYSYLEVLHSLRSKYGQPVIMGLEKTYWQDDRVRLQLEDTVTLKYIDIQKFSTIEESFTPEHILKGIDKYNFLKGL